jgi:hypothetical protein
MTTKRRLLTRRPKPVITEEMIQLFKRGLKIQAAGDHERWEDEGGRRDEYLALDKRLNITLLRKGWHEVSVLDPALDHQMPGYMKNLAAGRDWPVSVGQRRALLQTASAKRVRSQPILGRTNPLDAG